MLLLKLHDADQGLREVQNELEHGDKEVDDERQKLEQKPENGIEDVCNSFHSSTIITLLTTLKTQ